LFTLASVYVKMTAVGPVPLETVIDVECGKTSEPVSLFVKTNGKKPEDIVVDDEIAPKRQMTIEDGLRPLLASMKLFGLYLNRRRSDDDGQDLDKKSRKWNANTIYGAIVVTLLWINAVRMLSVFTREDRFGMGLFNKLISLPWSIQCAVSQTAFFAASFSGRLAVVFSQPLGDSCARHSRRFSTVLAIISWLFIMISMVCFIYVTFFTDFPMDAMTAPFQIHIIISNPVIPQIILQFFGLYQISAYVFSQAMTFVLAMIFCYEFKKVSKDLECCLDNQQRRVSDLDIETLRQKHQEISMTVSHLDDSLMFSNASAFCCQLACVIILLYVLIFYHSLMSDPLTITSYVFWMLVMFFGLALTAAGGIIVHHYVSPFSYLSLLLFFRLLLGKLVYFLAVFMLIAQSRMYECRIAEKDDLRRTGMLADNN